jgi:hypothetical protein
MQGLKKHLIPALITATTTLAVLVIVRPLGDFFDSVLKVISIHEEKLFLLQLSVSLLIVILGMLSYIFFLRKRFHYKKRFKFGVYWKEHTPYCPHCGGRLVENDTSYLQCVLCEQRITMPALSGVGHMRLRLAIEELKKDGL